VTDLIPAVSKCIIQMDGMKPAKSVSPYCLLSMKEIGWVKASQIVHNGSLAISDGWTIANFPSVDEHTMIDLVGTSLRIHDPSYVQRRLRVEEFDCRNNYEGDETLYRAYVTAEICRDLPTRRCRLQGLMPQAKNR
jgi:hypothetical protein